MARSDAKMDHLGTFWLFSGCSKRDMRTIAHASEEISVPAGKVLCEEGKPGREFFLIESGRAAVRRHGRKVATLTKGGYFGEMALLDRLPRSATIVSETPMELLVLGQREFFGLMDEVPGLAQKLMAAMAARLRESDAKAYH
jgi:CRP/FNR family transcriptional regulator, cyclic AMP receptor protein